MFKGPKYYQGKIIYEAEQRIKNEADFGNIVSSSRKSRIMSQTMLDSNTYTLMKYQQCKFIDVVEEKDFRKIRHTDLDSQVNNNASVDDVRDFLCVPNIDRDNTATSKKGGKTKGKSTKQPQETRYTPGAESELQYRIRNTLSHGVVKEATTSAKNINMVRFNKYNAIE